MEASISQIHLHPLRPPGFAEPLFLGWAQKKEIAEHLARSGWLKNASEGGWLGDCGLFRVSGLVRSVAPVVIPWVEFLLPSPVVGERVDRWEGIERMIRGSY